MKENQGQTREILLQLDPLKTQKATAALQRRLGSKTAELSALLGELLKVDDANFDERYRIFHEELVPLVQLYPSRWATPSPSRRSPRPAT